MTSPGETTAGIVSEDETGSSVIDRALVRLGRERSGDTDEINAHTDHTNTHSSNPW